MQYIETKFLPATNHKGARVKAWSSYGKDSLVLSYDYSLNTEEAHAKVAMALAEELGWFGDYICGGSDVGCVFVRKNKMFTEYTASEVFEVAA